jgi:hypothetical protein
MTEEHPATSVPEPVTAVPGASGLATAGEQAQLGRSLRRAATLTALAGIAHAALFLIAMLLLSTTPGAEASDAEIIEFYQSPLTRRYLLVGLYIMPFAGIAFLWFIVSMRLWIRAAIVFGRDELFSEVQLVSGILFVGLFLVSAAAISSTAAAVEFSETPIDPIEARILPGFGTTLLLVLAMRMAAIFVISSTNLARSSAQIPRWFVWSGYLVGIFLLLSVSLSPILTFVFPIWIIVLCLLLLQRARQIPRDVRVVPGVVQHRIVQPTGPTGDES